MKHHVHITFCEREVLKFLVGGTVSHRAMRKHLVRWVGTKKADQAIDRMLLLGFVAERDVDRTTGLKHGLLTLNPSGAKLIERVIGLPVMATYVPPKVVRRAGSEAFRDCPSVMGNQKVVMC